MRGYVAAAVFEVGIGLVYCVSWLVARHLPVTPPAEVGARVSAFTLTE